jgi:hypothetical protein
MRTFEVRISEELARTVEIEAENKDEAYDKARQMYDNFEIILNADDFVGTPEIRVGGQYGDILDGQAREDLANLYDYVNKDVFWSVLQCVGCENEFRRYLSEQGQTK